MARPRQDGLLYFSFDTDFFYADKNIKRLKAKFGSGGLLFYIYLLTEIYRNGYYTRWDSESVYDAMDALGLTEGFVKQAMAFLVSRSLIVKITLADPDTTIAAQKEGGGRPQCELADAGSGQKRAEAITSPGIQKRYQEAVKGKKRQIEVEQEIWLLSKEETASCIKVTQKYCFSGKNPSNSKKNESNSGKNDIKEKESKVKEIKEIKKEKEEELPCVERFDDFWMEYPNRQRRYLAEAAYCHLILSGSVTEDELVAAAKNYAAHIKEAGGMMYLPNNFLEKCVYEDYLEPEQTEPVESEGMEDEEDLAGEDEKWWKYGPNAWEE